MPPPTTATPQDVIRYLTRLLSAVCISLPDDTLRISKESFDEVVTESKGCDTPRTLFEDFDSASQEIVLRFRQQSLAQYFVKDAPCPQPTVTDSVISQAPLQQPNPPAPPQSVSTSQRQPPTVASPQFRQRPLVLDDATLARIEQKVRQMRLNRAAREQRSRSSSPLDENLFG